MGDLLAHDMVGGTAQPVPRCTGNWSLFGLLVPWVDSAVGAAAAFPPLVGLEFPLGAHRPAQQMGVLGGHPQPPEQTHGHSEVTVAT